MCHSQCGINTAEGRGTFSVANTRNTNANTPLRPEAHRERLTHVHSYRCVCVLLQIPSWQTASWHSSWGQLGSTRSSLYILLSNLRWLKLQQHVWQALNEIVWEFMEHIAHFVVCGNVFVSLMRLHYRWTVHAGLCSHGVSHSSPSYTFLTKSNEHLLHSWGLKVNVIALKIVVTL